MSEPSTAEAGKETPSANEAADSVVLEEEIDPNYVPSEAEVLEYATWLGMDLEKDTDLYWIAREGLMAPLPKSWKPCKMKSTGEIYYFNFTTGESTWDHPCDGYYKRLYEEEKKKKEIVLKESSDQKRTKAKQDVDMLLGKSAEKKSKKKKTLSSPIGPGKGINVLDKPALPCLVVPSLERKPLPDISAASSDNPWSSSVRLSSSVSISATSEESKSDMQPLQSANRISAKSKLLAAVSHVEKEEEEEGDSDWDAKPESKPDREVVKPRAKDQDTEKSRSKDDISRERERERDRTRADRDKEDKEKELRPIRGRSNSEDIPVAAPKMSIFSEDVGDMKPVDRRRSSADSAALSQSQSSMSSGLLQEIETLKSQLDDSHRKERSLSNQNQSLEEEADRLRTKLSALEREVSQQKSRVVLLEEQVNDFESRISFHKQASVDAQRNLAEAETASARRERDLRDKLEQARNDVDDLENEKRSQRKAIVDLESKLLSSAATGAVTAAPSEHDLKRVRRLEEQLEDSEREAERKVQQFRDRERDLQAEKNTILLQVEDSNRLLNEETQRCKTLESNLLVAQRAAANSDSTSGMKKDEVAKLSSENSVLKNENAKLLQSQLELQQLLRQAEVDMQVKESSLKYVQSSDSENKLRVVQLEGEVSALRKQVGELHAVASAKIDGDGSSSGAEDEICEFNPAEEKLKEQFESLRENYESELGRLRTKIKQLDTDKASMLAQSARQDTELRHARSELNRSASMEDSCRQLESSKMLLEKQLIDATSQLERADAEIAEVTQKLSAEKNRNQELDAERSKLLLLERELEKSRDREKEREREIERYKEKEKDRDREFEREREKERAREREREVERTEAERKSERDREVEWDKEKEQQQQREREVEREKERAQYKKNMDEKDIEFEKLRLLESEVKKLRAIEEELKEEKAQHSSTQQSLQSLELGLQSAMGRIADTEAALAAAKMEVDVVKSTQVASIILDPPLYTDAAHPVCQHQYSQTERNEEEGIDVKAQTLKTQELEQKLRTIEQELSRAAVESLSSSDKLSGFQSELLGKERTIAALKQQTAELTSALQIAREQQALLAAIHSENTKDSVIDSDGNRAAEIARLQVELLKHQQKVDTLSHNLAAVTEQLQLSESGRTEQLKQHQLLVTSIHRDRDDQLAAVTAESTELQRKLTQCQTEVNILKSKIAGLQTESDEYRKKWIESEGQGDTLRRTSRLRVEELEKQLHLLQQQLEDRGRDFEAIQKNKDRSERETEKEEQQQPYSAGGNGSALAELSSTVAQQQRTMRRLEDQLRLAENKIHSLGTVTMITQPQEREWAEEPVKPILSASPSRSFPQSSPGRKISKGSRSSLQTLTLTPEPASLLAADYVSANPTYYHRSGRVKFQADLEEYKFDSPDLDMEDFAGYDDDLLLVSEESPGSDDLTTSNKNYEQYMTRSLRLLAGRMGLRLQDHDGDGAAPSSSFSSSLLLDNCLLTEDDVGLGQSFRTLQQVIRRVAAEVKVRAKREQQFAGFADRLLERVKVSLQQEQKEIQELKSRWRQQRQKQKQQRVGRSDLDLVSINERTITVNSAVSRLKEILSSNRRRQHHANKMKKLFEDITRAQEEPLLSSNHRGQNMFFDFTALRSLLLCVRDLTLDMDKCLRKDLGLPSTGPESAGAGRLRPSDDLHLRKSPRSSRDKDRERERRDRDRDLYGDMDGHRDRDRRDRFKDRDRDLSNRARRQEPLEGDLDLLTDQDWDLDPAPASSLGGFGVRNSSASARPTSSTSHFSSSERRSSHNHVWDDAGGQTTARSAGSASVAASSSATLTASRAAESSNKQQMLRQQIIKISSRQQESKEAYDKHAGWLDNLMKEFGVVAHGGLDPNSNLKSAGRSQSATMTQSLDVNSNSKSSSRYTNVEEKPVFDL